ncbi:MAG: alpha/beta hydrolase [Saprospiraceae bacterium]
MAHSEDLSLKTFDGLERFGQIWPVENPRAVVIINHGIGEHVMRYAHFADFFVAQQIAVLGFDHRGHGRTGGKRGHTPNIKAFYKDIEQSIGEAKNRFPGTPVFLFGHSLGGNLVMGFTLSEKPNIAGVIASAPWIQLAFNPPKIKVFLGKLLAGLLPTLPQPNGLDVNYLSRDTDVVEKYVADPLVHDKITLATAAGMFDKADYLNEFTGKFPSPLLLLHGTADRLTSAHATEAFFQRNRFENDDMQLKLYRDFYHEIHNEPQRITEFTDILEWINYHL